jgi:hypothetical protein
VQCLPSQAVEADPFPDLSGGQPDATLGGTIRQNRAAHLAKLRHLYPIPGPIPDEVKETEQLVLIRDGSKIRTKVYVPVKQRPDGSPLVVMFHEGGECCVVLQPDETTY